MSCSSGWCDGSNRGWEKGQQFGTGCLESKFVVFCVDFDNKICTHLRGFGWFANDLCVGPGSSVGAVETAHCHFFGTAPTGGDEVDSMDGNADSRGCGFAFVQVVRIAVVVGAVGGGDAGDGGCGGIVSARETVGGGLGVGNGTEMSRETIVGTNVGGGGAGGD